MNQTNSNYKDEKSGRLLRELEWYMYLFLKLCAFYYLLYSIVDLFTINYFVIILLKYIIFIQQRPQQELKQKKIHQTYSKLKD